MRSGRFVSRVSLLAVTLCLVATVRGEIKPKVVSFTTSDGVKIVADYFAPAKSASPSPFVILLHTYGNDRTAWKPLIEPLHGAGFAIMAIDMRGYGDSATDELRKKVEKRDRKHFKAMEKDVYAAYGWLAKQSGVDRSRFALVGASVGCSVALRYTVSDPSVDAVVCMTPGTNYLGINSSTDVKRFLGRKLLFLASEGEREASYKLKELSDKAGKKAKDGAMANKVEVRMVGEGRIHGTNMFGAVDGIERRIVEFLTRAVGSSSEDMVVGAWKNKTFHKPESGGDSSADQDRLRYLSDKREAVRRGLKSTEKKPIAPPIGN